MELQVRDERRVYLDTRGDGLDVSGETFGPLQMLATSLVLCTASVINAYAETAQLTVDGFAVEATWNYADDPHRVGSYHLTLHLPSTVLPGRHAAIVRAADTGCTVHTTLTHSPSFEPTTVIVFDAASAAAGVHHHVHQA